MKQKKFNKKLAFSKSTISNLNGPEMSNVRGGEGETEYSCPFTFDAQTCIHTVNNTNCASNCICGTLGPDCS